MRLHQNLQKLRNQLKRNPTTQSPPKYRRRLVLEYLEDRTLLSTIIWTNRGNSGSDTDNFNHVFGANADIARSDVDAVLSQWANVIVNFNYADASLNNTYHITVSMSNSAGLSASASITGVSSDGKPTSGSETINTGPWYLDPTPSFNEEFRGTLVNPYTALPTPGGPADGQGDFFSFVMAESAHCMGLVNSSSLLFRQDPNHYLTNTGQADVFDTPGTLWTYNGPDVQALFTSNNGGGGGSDTGAALHTAEPPNQVTSGGITYFGVDDTNIADGNASFRLLVSNLDALVLHDSYGYTVNSPATLDNMYINFDPGSGNILVRGGTHGRGIYSQQNNPSNDVITLDSFTLFGTLYDYITVSIGNPVPGTGPNVLYSGTFVDSQVLSITVDAGDGSNVININSVTPGTTVNVINSATSGPDQINIGSGGSVQRIQGTINLSNTPSFNNITIDDSADTTGRSVTLSSFVSAGATWGQLTGLEPGVINYKYADTRNVTILTGGGGDIIAVQATGGIGTTTFVGDANATVTVGNAGSVQGVGATLTFDNSPAFYTITVDDSADTIGRNVTLSTFTPFFDSAFGAISGLAPVSINYELADTASPINISGGSGGNTFNILGTGAQTINLFDGAGSDMVNVQATGFFSTLNINNGFSTSSDTVNIGSTAPSLGGTLANIAGAVNVSNASGHTTLNVDDSGDVTGQTFTITNGSITGTWSPGSINYSNTAFGGISALNIFGGGGGNTFNVQSTLAGTTTSIDTNHTFANSNNTVNIGSLAPSLGGTLANITGPVNVSNTSGHTALTVDDSGDGTGQTVTVTNSSVTGTWSSAAINYTGGDVSSLTLLGGKGGNTFNVQSTAAGTTTSIITDNTTTSSNNTVNIGSLAPSLGGTLANIAGPVNVSTGSGNTVLTVDDSGDATARSATIINNSITGLSPAAITYTKGFGTITSLTILGGSGGNTFNVQSTAAGTTTLINAGSNNNIINAGNTSSVQNILGDLILESRGGSTTLTVDDSSDSVFRSVTMSTITIANDSDGDSDAFGQIAGLAPANIDYEYADASSLTISTGPGGCNFDVEATGVSTRLLGQLFGTSVIVSGAVGNVQGIQAPLTIENQTGRTAFSVNDSTDSTPRTVNLNTVTIPNDSDGDSDLFTQITGIAPAAINYEANETASPVTILGGTGGNTFNIFGTGPEFLNLATGTGSDTVNVRAVSAGGLHIFGQNGNDTVTIGSNAPSLGGTLANIAGPLFIDNFLGQTALIVDDSGDSSGRTATITNSSITGLSPFPINYGGFPPSPSGVISVTVLGGSGGNTFNVQSTALGTPVSLNAGSGTDGVNVGNAGSVQGIQGNLAIEGPAVTLTVDDSANTTGRTATLDTFIPSGETIPFGRITGLAPAVITYELADTASPITIKGGSGGNTFNILSTGSQTLNLSSGTGSDVVNVQAISGPLNLNGQAGNDTVTLGSVAPAIGGVLANLNGAITISNPSGATALTIDDSVDPVNRTTATITSSSTTGLSPFAINYANLSSLTIDGGTGANKYAVQSTASGTSVVLNAGSGHDTVNVGNAGNSLANLLGPLTVNSQASLTALNINDEGSPGQTYTLTATTLLRSGAALITYDPVTILTINAGGNDTLTVVSTAFGTHVTFKGGGGTNTLIGPNFPSTFNITSNNGGTVGNVTFSSVQNLTGGSADDTFKFSNGKGVVGTINGGGGTNTLDYSLYTTGVNVNLPAGTATGTGGVSNIQNVTGSPKNDTIVGIAGSVIRGNGGMDTLSGGPNDTFIMGATQLAGTTVNGAGSGNTLVGANITNTWALNAPGGGTLNVGITFSGIANLIGGSGIDKFQFLPTGGVTGIIDGAGGSNTLDYSLFGGPIAVNLQTSAATGTGGFLHIGTLAGSGNIGDMLTGTNASSTWTLTGSGAGTVGSFHFSAIANLTGGTGADTFKFMPGGSVAGMIDGGGGSNKLDYSANGGPIAVALTGPASGTASGYGFANIQTLVGSGNALDMLTGANTNNIWNITNPNAGNINSTFNFSKIANLVGGTGVDVFKIATAGSISGNINGGSTSGDWLDYSANAKLINVNLAAGTATSVGTVSNIQNVFGGNGGNNLTGNAQGNILIGGNGNDVITGGTGRSLLIGGKGNDQVTGGSGGDILIGGFTTYDQTHNLAALASILAEWQNPMHDYATRISDLKTGGGLNGTNTLVLGTTVKDDGKFNTLTGGVAVIPGDLDWFFKGVNDTLVNQEAGEQVN